MTLEIMALQEEDIEETIQVVKEAWQYAYDKWERGYYPKEGHEFDQGNNTPELYKKHLALEQGYFFIAKVDGRVAGSIRGEIIGISGFAQVRNIVVHQDYHRQGVGRALMEHALGYLEGQGCHKVSLHTFPVLIPAINLYLKMGFIPEAYLAKQWWGVDFIMMSKWFK